MRCRTSGSSAKRTISWISFLPPSSAGWDLPAMISWIGRSGWSSSFLSRPGSREADGQHVGVERGVDPAELGLGDAAVLAGLRQPAARVVDQPLAQLAL